MCGHGPYEGQASPPGALSLSPLLFLLFSEVNAGLGATTVATGEGFISPFAHVTLNKS